jgi:tetratricopeptide (TPR) repeat protein
MKVKKLTPFDCILFFLTLLVLVSCSKNKKDLPYSFGTSTDEALTQFHIAWEYILDHGQWTLSEEAFRKAVELDPSFLVGKSLVGKITRNLDERITIFEEVNREKHKASEDDLLLLEITLKTMELFNKRDQNIEINDQFIREFYHLGESNYRKFVNRHPEESYMKAEYIEFIHANQGPKAALDSLNLLASDVQSKLPFFISYGALLEAEMGNYESALSIAHQFKQETKDDAIPAPYVLYAQIYNQMDSLELAIKHIDVAIELDTNHIIAQRLKSILYSE